MDFNNWANELRSSASESLDAEDFSALNDFINESWDQLAKYLEDAGAILLERGKTYLDDNMSGPDFVDYLSSNADKLSPINIIPWNLESWYELNWETLFLSEDMNIMQSLSLYKELMNKAKLDWDFGYVWTLQNVDRVLTEIYSILYNAINNSPKGKEGFNYRGYLEKVWAVYESIFWEWTKPSIDTLPRSMYSSNMIMDSAPLQYIEGQVRGLVLTWLVENTKSSLLNSFSLTPEMLIPEGEVEKTIHPEFLDEYRVIVSILKIKWTLGLREMLDYGDLKSKYDLAIRSNDLKQAKFIENEVLQRLWAFTMVIKYYDSIEKGAVAYDKIWEIDSADCTLKTLINSAWLNYIGIENHSILTKWKQAHEFNLIKRHDWGWATLDWVSAQATIPEIDINVTDTWFNSKILEKSVWISDFSIWAAWEGYIENVDVNDFKRSVFTASESSFDIDDFDLDYYDTYKINGFDFYSDFSKYDSSTLIDNINNSESFLEALDMAIDQKLFKSLKSMFVVILDNIDSLQISYETYKKLNSVLYSLFVSNTISSRQYSIVKNTIKSRVV